MYCCSDLFILEYKNEVWQNDEPILEYCLLFWQTCQSVKNIFLFFISEFIEMIQNPDFEPWTHLRCLHFILNSPYLWPGAEVASIGGFCYIKDVMKCSSYKAFKGTLQAGCHVSYDILLPAPQSGVKWSVQCTKHHTSQEHEGMVFPDNRPS